jgi:ArsR family transcriptional regulator, arsenate/arsenite/antimonite-responsive transcriptional repressor
MGSAKVERISKALANETRLLIFEAIAGNKEMNSSAIVTMRGVAAATVSHHLKILSHAGLIECRRQGRFVHNRAVPETIENNARELSRLVNAGVGRRPPRHWFRISSVRRKFTGLGTGSRLVTSNAGELKDARHYRPPAVARKRPESWFPALSITKRLRGPATIRIC